MFDINNTMQLQEKDVGTMGDVKKTEENEITLVYHRNYNVLTCYCGKLIRGSHQCLLANKEVNTIKVVECDEHGLYQNITECSICIKKEKEKRFTDQ